MEKKVNWDSIPSLEGLEVDWDYGKNCARDKRAFVRLNLDDMGQLFEVSEIKVKVGTVQQIHDGVLLDVSAGGAAVKLSAPLEVQQPIKIGFVLSNTPIVAKGQVRHMHRLEKGYKIGLEFIDLDPNIKDYIGGLYASKVLGHGC